VGCNDAPAKYPNGCSNTISRKEVSYVSCKLLIKRALLDTILMCGQCSLLNAWLLCRKKRILAAF